MNRFETYYAKARQLADDDDPFVSLIARNVHYNMLNCKASPIGIFNFLYFVQACIDLWLADHPEVKLLPSTKFRFPTGSIMGSNWPDSDVPSPRCFSNRFCANVRDDSIPSGNSFDVSYAMRILALTFSDDGEVLSPVSHSELIEIEDDYWLSGFNTEQ